MKFSRDTLPLCPDWFQRELLHDDATPFSCFHEGDHPWMQPRMPDMLPNWAINLCRLLRLSVRSATHRMLCDDPAAGSRNQCDTGMPETCHPGHRRISAGTELFWKTLSQILQRPYHDIVRGPCRMEGKVADGEVRQENPSFTACRADARRADGPLRTPPVYMTAYRKFKSFGPRSYGSICVSFLENRRQRSIPF